jgi:hypothetical protein
MNLQAYAAHRKAQGLRGTSHVAVLKAIESGRLTEPAVRKVDGRWHIDATLADQQWAGNTDPRGALPPPPAPIDTRQPHPAGGGPSLAEAKRAKAIYEAELTRIELQRTKKELISADEVRQEASRLGRQVRDLLLIIPGRNAAKLATMQDSQAISDLLEAEITNALRGLQDEAA